MKNITTTEEFNSVIQSEQPVIVKFEAGWCPDCKAMDMWIDPIVDKYNDYKWYSVNRDELEDVASDNEVMGIPSLLIHCFTIRTPTSFKFYNYRLFTLNN
jgi:thioredoxin-like negative regulator of GroEL